MFHLSEPELAAIDRNHARLAKIGDRHRTLDLFAAHRGAEDLTLIGEQLTPATTRTETTTASPQLCFFL